MNIHTTEDPQAAADFVAEIIAAKLDSGEHVLWFATGGSSIVVASLAAKIIKEHRHKNLTVMMTDERYGPVGYKDSNWQQLMEKGFELPDAKLIPILTGDSRDITAERFNQLL